ncbi:MAG: sigma factor-like helix-turn-helix DNA-binding protein [Gemella sp.]|nr:sigma factor-like helix-turn-helix DNA-binding protein [Gemella sp.]
MEIKKILEVTHLYDYYADLLSDKQSEYLKNYYFEDLSLTEMSEIYGISKQAISNNIKRSIADLEEYERKLSLIELSNQRKLLLEEISKINKDNDVATLVDHLLKLEN